LVDDFNATFHLLEKQRKQHAVLCRTGTPPDFLPLDIIFALAESEYRDMQTLNKWSGIHTKSSSAFNASHPSDGSGPTTQVCFNCGRHHHVKECKKPRDETTQINLRLISRCSFARNRKTTRAALEENMEEDTITTMARPTGGLLLKSMRTTSA
jgi:hypothetical protein